MKTIKKYLNPVQALFVMATQLIKVLIGGRGLGKTTILANEVIDRVTNLPRSRGIFVGLTFAQLQTKTLPPIMGMWEDMGYYEGIHYVIGKAPPKGYKHPYHKPLNYKNIISWWNGTTVELGSFDRKDHLRGGSNDWIIVDEASLIKKPRYNSEILPTLRPTSWVFLGKKGHLSQIFVSSMPWLESGKWLLDYEVISKTDPEDYFYIEGTSWHNRFILTDATILRWKKEMEPAEFQIECLNQRKTKLGHKFYPNLNERVHYYDGVFDYDYTDTLGFSSDLEADSRHDLDCDPNLPLSISFDFGAFNCLVVGQEQGREFKVLNNFYTEKGQILDDVIDSFCKYYKHHKKRKVLIFGDRGGNSRQSNSRHTLHEEIRVRLKDNGWSTSKARVMQIGHYEKFNFFSRLFGEEETGILPAVRFNKFHCKKLIISMENAGMKRDKKDKSSERADIPQEHATHLSDALDYMLYVLFYTRKELPSGDFQPVHFQ